MLHLRRKGTLFVLSAPSGAGKSTLCAMALKEMKNLVYSVSCTTRKPRPGEKNGVHYFFLSEKEFKRKIKQRGFFEWAPVHGNYYGTPKYYIEENIRKGRNIILDIDVQGGVNIKKQMPSAVLIYVLPPAFTELEKRLRARKQDSTSVIELRLKNAGRELKYLPKYDYVIMNDELGRAYYELKNIIAAEHSSIKRVEPKEIIRDLLKSN